MREISILGLPELFSFREILPVSLIPLTFLISHLLRLMMDISFRFRFFYGWFTLNWGSFTWSCDFFCWNSFFLRNVFRTACAWHIEVIRFIQGFWYVSPFAFPWGPFRQTYCFINIIDWSWPEELIAAISIVFVYNSCEFSSLMFGYSCDLVH